MIENLKNGEARKTYGTWNDTHQTWEVKSGDVSFLYSFQPRTNGEKKEHIEQIWIVTKSIRYDFFFVDNEYQSSKISYTGSLLKYLTSCLYFTFFRKSFAKNLQKTWKKKIK